MNKIKKILSLILTAVVVVGGVFTLSRINVKAANNPDALALGFEVDESQYNCFLIPYRKVKQAYVTDANANTHCVGELIVQTIRAKSKTPIYMNYQEEVWLTRITTIPSQVNSYTYKQSGIKKKTSLKFFTKEVKEDTPMPNNVMLDSYIATSPSMLLSRTITRGWSMNGTGSYNCKNISIGIGAEIGLSSTNSINLYSVYNESRTTAGFKVTYTCNGGTTEKEKSYMYNKNLFYTAKHVYGSPEIMARVQGVINVSCSFDAKYGRVQAFSLGVRPGLISRPETIIVTVRGKTSVSVVNSLYQ